MPSHIYTRAQTYMHMYYKLSFTWERDRLIYLPCCWLVNWVLNPRSSSTWTQARAAPLASSAVNRLRLFLRQLLSVCVCESSFIQPLSRRARSQVQFCLDSDSAVLSLSFIALQTHTYQPPSYSSSCDASVAACSDRFVSGLVHSLGFRSQWVERTLGLAGFVSHGCGYICPLDCCFSIM